MSRQQINQIAQLRDESTDLQAKLEAADSERDAWKERSDDNYFQCRTLRAANVELTATIEKLRAKLLEEFGITEQDIAETKTEKPNDT